MHLRKISLAIAFAASCFFSFNASAVDSGKTTWLWDTSALISTSKTITTADKVQINNLIAFCKNKRVTEIYLQINRDIRVEKYQYLVASLGAAQVIVENRSYPIKVHALDGADNWITPDGASNKKAFFDWVFAYQTKANMNQRLAGIHLDVEPYTSALWRSEVHHDKAIAAYQGFINDAIKRVEDAKSGIGVPARLPGDLPLSFAIPFWFDGETYIDKAILPYAYNPSLPLPNNLAEWLYANTKIAALAVMTYRDSLEGQGGGMWGVASKDLILGVRYSKKTIVSADVSPVKGTDPTYITFYEEGEAAMLNVLNGLRTKIDNTSATKTAKYAFAIHDYNNWLKIKP
ncbi:hypothetical protein [Undibacterium flavidum]|uniref:Glycosyl hydrolase family 10 n=1 Tax=Undibacterium flavidum TaxID=2762297 RepID=A0ABR6Y9F1_9BURK|nr:hypothetical protein [Undibacterium flavidum]MBC3873209.1 hypothetical protein [Undibacterium flavidum]